jgi:Ca2+-binding RTX toxin-like protein
MVGGVGNDIYEVYGGVDQNIVELAGDAEGYDMVRYYTDGTYQMAANVEEARTSTWVFGGVGTYDITGNSLNNVIFGFTGNDTLSGGEGNDSLGGNGGEDLLIGDLGNDNMLGGGGLDTLVGGVGNDTLWGGTEDDDIHGGEGDDQLVGEDGNDYLFGSDGNDIAYGAVGNDLIDGGAGNDTLSGNGGEDHYYQRLGSGIDLIREGDTVVGNINNGENCDTLHFEDIDYNHLWFKQVGNNLEISVVGSTDKTTVEGWFTATTSQVEFIRDDLTGHMTDATKISALVSVMSQFTPQDMSLAQAPAALITARNNAWTIA